MLVGEAPGQTEITERRPFVGQSGELLRGIVEPLAESAGKRLYITNAVKCGGPTNEPPPVKAILLCREAYLDDELARFKGRKIVALGRVPTHALYRRARRLFELIGHPTPDLVPTKLVRSVWHPAYYLRGHNRMVKVDIARALRWGLREETKVLGPRGPVDKEVNRVEIPGAGRRDDEGDPSAA